MSNLENTRQFWNHNPCGASGGFIWKKRQRYETEPWLQEKLEKICIHPNILEVGCGQGVDLVEIVSNGLFSGKYTAIDYSENSLLEAYKNIAENVPKTRQDCIVLRQGNAEMLDFPDDTFDAVYSMGVIHHTPSIENAIHEIHRVLKPGGTAYLALYRSGSIKIEAAKFLRKFQGILDGILGTDRVIYKIFLSKISSSNRFGTMFHECFGVPILNSYTAEEIKELFLPFKSVSIEINGHNFGKYSSKGSGKKNGSFNWIEVKK